jgi:class 3 adenylate cyclase/tetratricopeptide (TPR) repeat protein
VSDDRHQAGAQSSPAKGSGLRIFLNYRRDDTSGHAMYLYNLLAAHFGDDQIFMDIDTLEPGSDFAEVIEREVGSCDVLIALIGKQWLTLSDANGSRRLDEAEDFVAGEIKAALDRDIRVIPTLVQNASPPSRDQLPSSLEGLARRHAFELHEQSWQADVARLIASLETVSKERGRSSLAPEDRDGARDFGEVAAPPGAPARPIAEERKVVTSLFCDLVGTANPESSDPEDVDQMLAAYSQMARAQIEAHGGTVEPYIGDAVVGIFGVPAAHEDDAERAVRAGLRIAENAEELEVVGGAPLRLRVGVSTGEALVRLGVTPGSGERLLAGGAINTAAHLQSAAPEMGVAVGLSTYEVTADVFDYEELEPAMFRGRSEPVRLFHAMAPRARLGIDLTRTHDTRYIGREIDLALLKSTFDKADATNSVHLVTVVGEPGIGKSRIVAELGASIDSRPGLVTWRQGRCLPYGEGITFWALGEIVKGHAGILESDAPEAASSKLDAVLPQGPEREWFRQRLLPLLGIEASSSAERGELFTAWRRFLEQIAEVHPTVLVFEDLHWADDAMLEFLEHLADRAEGVPMLVIGTARPELFERHRDYAAGLRNANTINLSPLSIDETARLVSALLATSVISTELLQPILDRAEGNPLYAEEFVRLLKDRDLLEQEGSSWALKRGADVPFPDSVQALIAARVDTLEPGPKSLLADAAVVGKVFWAGAVAAMGERDPQIVTDTLRELSRKELVRPARRSSIEGEAEHSFWHILTRDVVYAQLPRASRASRHVAAAAWIEAKVSERTEGLADVLAYHYSTALELARAAGQTERAARLEAPALRFLMLAGDHALGLDTAAALGNFERTLALAPSGHPARPEALRRYGEAALQAGRFAEAAEALDEAIGSFRASGDLGAAVRAMLVRSRVMTKLGDPRAWELPAQALALLEPFPPGLELVGALTEVASVETFQGRFEAGVGYAERALDLAEELGLDLPARALGYRGLARCGLGDSGGLEDFREAIRLATEAGQGREVCVLHNNLGLMLWLFEGPVVSLELMRAGIAFAHGRGLSEMVESNTASTLDLLVDCGELEEALEVASGIADHLGDEDVWDLVQVRAEQARILALRGQAAHVAGSLDWLESTARGAGVAEIVVSGLGSSAHARAGLGQNEAAAALLEEVEASPGARISSYYAACLPQMVRTALAIGHRELAQRLAGGVEPLYPYAEHALVTANAALAEVGGDLQVAADAYAEATDRWERFGVVLEHAFALLGQGRCLIQLAGTTEAAHVLRQARGIFDLLGAHPALSETDALLREATAIGS